MKYFIVLIITFIFQLSLAETGNTFSPEKWDALVRKSYTEGSVLEDGNTTFFFLGEITPNDISKPRTAQYFTTIGHYENDSPLVVDEVQAISEKWTIDSEKNWNVDQWFFKLDKYGNLLSVYRSNLVESSSGSVIRNDQVDITPTEGFEKWNRELEFWFEQ